MKRIFVSIVALITIIIDSISKSIIWITALPASLLSGAWSLLCDFIRYIGGIFEAWADRFAALWDRMLGLHRDEDPARLYGEQLSASTTASLAAYERQISHLQYMLKRKNESLESALAAEKAGTNREIKLVQEFVKSSKEELNKAEEGDDDFSTARQSYKTWQDAVGRPPLSEKFEALFANSSLLGRPDAKEARVRQAIESEEGKKTTWLASLGGSISSLVRRVMLYGFAPTAIGIDVLYTLPSFEFLLEGKHKNAALAAALFFTLALVILGDAVGRFATRVRNRKVVDKKLCPKTNWFAVSMIGALIFFGVASAHVAANLRSIVPQVNQLKERQVKLEKEIKRLPPPPIGEDPDAATRDRLNKEEINIRDDESGLRGSSTSQKHFDVKWYNTADGQVAFILYIILIFSQALKHFLEKDPIPEYGAAYEYYRDALRSYYLNILGHKILNIFQLSGQNKLERKLDRVEKAPAEAFKEITEEIDRLNLSINELMFRKTEVEKKSLADIRTRVRRYVKYYLCFGRSRIPNEMLARIQSHLKKNVDYNKVSDEALIPIS